MEGDLAAARARAMGERVLRTAREVGTPEAELPLLERAYALAMAPRLDARLGSHDPHLLHPGRSALILLLDTAEVRGAVLAAAMLAESERPELGASAARAREGLMEREVGAAAAEAALAWAAEVPMPGDEDLAERLVVADEEVQRAALAERLDHLRHAHLWGDPERARSAHARAVEVYLPVAERVHPVLARRYLWWCEAFARKAQS